MRIAIIGTGAMGSVYAGLLADAGNEVWAVDTWGAHIDAIRTEGLRVSGASGDRRVHSIQATERADEIGVVDLIVIATKAADVEAAVRSILPMVAGDTAVLLMQNGLGSHEAAVGLLPEGHVLQGVAQAFGASVLEPGHARHNGMDLIRIGEPEGPVTARVAAIVEAWARAGFTARAEDDITRLLWEKFVCNTTFSAPCTVFGRTVGEMMSDAETWAISTGCAVEAYQVGKTLGVAFSFDDPVAYVTAYGDKVRGARPSMLLDHMAGRRSEIDFINGRVPVEAAKVGLSAPFNQTLSAVVRAREAGF